MKKLLAVALALAAGVAVAADGKLAVFVQNRTTVPGMNDEVDGIRDRLAAALAATELQVVDSAQVADAFRRHKVTAAEEKAELVPGIFTGGSVPSVARMVGCDYIAAASVVGASAAPRTISGQPATVYTLRMTLKILDAAGTSVWSMPPWTKKLPVLNAAGDGMEFYNTMLDEWAETAGAAIANNSATWKKAPPAAAPVKFRISTTVDRPIAALESQTKGVKGERLAELRKVAGGATIELDGALVGTAPAEISATPGIHQLKVTRAWMKPFAGTVQIVAGGEMTVALELSDEGVAKWGTVEKLQSNVAREYADAAMTRGIKVKVDSTNWRDVTAGADGTISIKQK